MRAATPIGPREWLRRAEELLAEAPEASADQHRGWIRDQAAELDV